MSPGPEPDMLLAVCPAGGQVMMMGGGGGGGGFQWLDNSQAHEIQTVGDGYGFQFSVGQKLKRVANKGEVRVWGGGRACGGEGWVCVWRVGGQHGSVCEWVGRH